MLRIAILYTSRWPLCCADPVELCELSSSLIVQSPRDCSRPLHVPDTVRGAGVRLCVMFSTAVVPLSPSPSLRHYLLTHYLIFRLYSPSQSASMIPTSTVTVGKHLFAVRRRSLYAHVALFELSLYRSCSEQIILALNGVPLLTK